VGRATQAKPPLHWLENPFATIEPSDRPNAPPRPFQKDDMSQLEDEAALNAAWAVLRKHDVPDGLLGVYYLQTHETFVLHYEEEGCPYFEWVRLAIPNLETLPVPTLEEAAERLAKRMAITRRRFIDPRKHLQA
jgi:hypothetical protein